MGNRTVLYQPRLECSCVVSGLSGGVYKILFLLYFPLKSHTISQKSNYIQNEHVWNLFAPL